MAGVMSWWMLAMVAYPEMQKHGQAELDSVIGRDHVPSFSDFEHLPYIHAMAKEALSWCPIDPVSLPHHIIQDNWYKGMYTRIFSLIPTADLL